MSAPPPPEIIGLVPAAGLSRRFPAGNKLLHTSGEPPLLLRTVSVLQQAGIQKIICVSGADHAAMHRLLAPLGIACLQNPNYAEGMGSSIAFGASQIEEPAGTGILICLADLPLLTSDTVKKVSSHFIATGGQQITVPCHQNRLGHPILFPSRFLSELRQLSGDRGAKAIIRREHDSLLKVPIESPEIYLDFDRPEDGDHS